MYNFEFIASNVTSCYMLMHREFPNMFSEEDMVYLGLAACALPYLKNGKITADDIKQCLVFANICQCGIFPSVAVYGNFITERDVLLGSIMQLECLILRCESNITTSELVSLIVSKKEFIHSVINNTKLNAPPHEIQKKLFAILMLLLRAPQSTSIIDGLSDSGKDARNRIKSIIETDNRFSRKNTDDGDYTDKAYYANNDDTNKKIESKNDRASSIRAIFTILMVAVIAIVTIVTELQETMSPQPTYTPSISHTPSENPVILCDPPTFYKPTYYTLDKPVAPFQINLPRSSSNEYYYVLLVNASTKEKIVSVFSPAGHFFNFDVPLGDFALYYASGQNWYGYQDLFGSENSYYAKANDILKFYNAGNYYSGNSITLYPVSYGNMASESIEIYNFPK